MKHTESGSEKSRQRPRRQRRAYLDDLGIYEPSTEWTNASEGQEDKRQRIWDAQQRRYGFDSRQTWSLHNSMTELLYERLKAYLPLADSYIDLELHKISFEGEELTQKEAIERLIGYCREALAPDFDSEDYQGEKVAEKLWNLWAVLHPYMWW